MTQTVTLGGGCFWCLEAVYQEMKGIRAVRSGYMGGKSTHPTYKEVCSGTSGHVEVVQLDFDAESIAFEDVLDVFFAIHDPTTRDRQGNDVGSQYRSVIFFHTEEQRQSALARIRELEASGQWTAPVVTEVRPAEQFWVAEDYHHNYFRDNPNQPYCAYVVSPKVSKFRQKFTSMRNPSEKDAGGG